MTRAPDICLIGFGEVGQILAADLKPHAKSITAWDILFTDKKSAPSKAAKDIQKGANASDAARDATIVISAVTAAQTVKAAASVGGALKNKAFYLDLNSASPGTKKDAAAVIKKAGGRFVEAAVMSPIGPKRTAAPMLFGGPDAEAFLPVAKELGFAGASVFSNEIGAAAAAKMCRSIMIKGIEALLSESLLSARRYGVEDTVIASLTNLFPGPDWPTLSRYMISRALEHGRRRAEEMREAAKTVEEAGLSPLMSLACAERQEFAAAFAYALEKEDLHDMLDAILEGAGAERRL